MNDNKLKIANKYFRSRLIVGTGKYKSFDECAKAVKTSPEKTFRNKASKPVPELLTKPRRDTVALAIENSLIKFTFD